jgi:hypothetical protein
MAGITQREREDRQRILDVKAMLADPTLPRYLNAKYQGVLNTLQRIQDRRVAERKAKLRAERDAAENRPNWCVLPDNKRSPQPNGYKVD